MEVTRSMSFPGNCVTTLPNGHLKPLYAKTSNLSNSVNMLTSDSADVALDLLGLFIGLSYSYNLIL